MRCRTLLLFALLLLAPRPASAQTRAVLLPDGEHIGVLTPPSVPATWRPADPSRPERWDTRLRNGGSSSTRDGTLVVDLGPPAARPPQPSRRAVRVHELVLLRRDGTPFAQLSCPEVDVLDAANSAPARVRAYGPHGLVLEGLAQAPLRPAEWGTCGARVSTEERPPDGYLPVRRDVPERVRLTGSIWWRAGGRCSRWSFHRQGEVLSLEQRRRVRTNEYAYEDTVYYNFEGPIDALSIYAPGVRRRMLWTAPRASGGPGLPGPIGAVFPVRFVRASPQSVTWVSSMTPSSSITGYHPADAVTWFRSEAACVSGPGRGDGRRSYEPSRN